MRTLWLMMLMLTSATVMAVSGSENTEQMPADNESCHVRQNGEASYVVSAGEMKMVIDAAFGGRIRSLQLGDTEMLSQTEWPESFGSTFWTSPQKDWNWPPVPEIDKLPYSSELRGDTLLLCSQVAPGLGYCVQKEFRVTGDAIAITYVIENKSDEERRVAPWEITRVRNEGLIFFDAAADSIVPAGLMDFSQRHGAAWYVPDVRNENRKVNADGQGWLAYANGRLLMLKQFQNLQAGQAAPDEAEIQVYVNRGKTYIELESQGAYTTLKPGQSLRWTVLWRLMRCEENTTPSEALIKKVREVINP